MLQSFQKWSGATSQHLSPLTRAATKVSPEMCQVLKNSTAINWVKGVSTFAHCCGGQDMTRLLEPDQNPLMNTVKGRSSARKSGAFLPLKYNCLLQTGKSADTTDSPSRLSQAGSRPIFQSFEVLWNLPGRLKGSETFKIPCGEYMA